VLGSAGAGHRRKIAVLFAFTLGPRVLLRATRVREKRSKGLGGEGEREICLPERGRADWSLILAGRETGMGGAGLFACRVGPNRLYGQNMGRYYGLALRVVVGWGEESRRGWGGGVPYNTAFLRNTKVNSQIKPKRANGINTGR